MFLTATGIPKHTRRHALRESLYGVLLSYITSFVGDSSFRCLRTFPTASCRHHVFRNVQYVAVKQRLFQSIRVVFLTLEGLQVPFEYSTKYTKVVLHFRKNYHLYFFYETYRQHPS